MTGEPEDTDVGYPGPEHHIAERARPMSSAMVLLAIGSIFLGLLQIPEVTHVIDTFLEPTFADSRFANVEVSGSINALALVVGAATSLTGIALAWWLYVRERGLTLRLAGRLRALHSFLEHKWYFDELNDALFVRPTRAFGSWAQNVFERVVIQGLVGGASYAVRVGNSLVRVAQSGILRYYALLLMAGVSGLALYFLVVSR